MLIYLLREVTESSVRENMSVFYCDSVYNGYKNISETKIRLT